MQNFRTEIPPNGTPATGKTKKRHGCLTAWLILLIVAASITISLYLFGESVLGSLEDFPEWTIPVLVTLLVLEIACAIALLMWKKWGFWGYCAITMTTLIINISLGAGVFSFSGLIGIAILYGVLNIGKENKGWPQLD